MLRSFFNPLGTVRAEAVAAARKQAETSRLVSRHLDRLQYADDPFGAFIHDIRNAQQRREKP